MKLQPATAVTVNAGAAGISAAARAGLMELLGISEAAAPAAAVEGGVMVVVPGYVRAPKLNEICPWTGLSGPEFAVLRTEGARTSAGECLMPPFGGWYADNEAEEGRRVVHVDLPALYDYLRRRTEIARERREKAGH